MGHLKDAMARYQAAAPATTKGETFREAMAGSRERWEQIERDQRERREAREARRKARGE